MPQAKKSTERKAASAIDGMAAQVHKELEQLKKKVAAAQKNVQATTSRAAKSATTWPSVSNRGA